MQASNPAVSSSQPGGSGTSVAPWMLDTMDGGEAPVLPQPITSNATRSAADRVLAVPE